MPDDLKIVPKRATSATGANLLALGMGREPNVAAHAADRWARAVMCTLGAAADPRTVDAWGRLAGAAPSTLRVWCAAAHCGTRSSLSFARVLRAVCIAQVQNEWDPANLLDVVDARTLHRLLSKAGVPLSSGSCPTPEQFIRGHRFGLHPRATRAIAELLGLAPTVDFGRQPLTSRTESSRAAAAVRKRMRLGEGGTEG